MRRFGLIVVLLAAACAHPPKPAPVPAAPKAALYIAPDSVDILELLPPPPAAGSPEQAQDLKTLETLQRERSAERFALARADIRGSADRIAMVLAPGFSIEKLPKTMHFFEMIGRSTGPYYGLTKYCFERLRPFVVDKKITPTPDFLKSAAIWDPKAAPPATPQGPGSPCRPVEPEKDYSYSYPSGHSVFGTMTAILLAQMVPEKRAALYARGWEYGESRMVGGVHYPTDVAAGRIQATLLVAAMMQSDLFKADFAAARAELRAELGLPS